NIHRGQNATLEDDWGVSPNEGFEVPLSDYHRRLVDRYRRARDLQIPASTWTGVPPGVEAFPEEQRGEQDENAEATVAAPIDDPQLRRAIQYLQQRMSAVTSPSR
ncbi:MAG: hypothetical protein ACKOU6_10045, partial [Planctomycetota bacterium]